MFNFIKTSFPHVRRSSQLDNKLFYIQQHPFSSISNPHSVSTVSFLVNSFGFTPQKALSASRYFKKTPAKADSVVAFFKNHGFSDTQISKLVNTIPTILVCDPQKTLLPKISFFNSVGLSSDEVTKMLTSSPFILRRSIDKLIIPNFNFFKTLHQSNEKALLYAIKHYPTVLTSDIQALFPPNIETLKESGVPESNILMLLTRRPRVFVIDNKQFRKIVEEVKEMGFNPMRKKFVFAIQTLRAMSKPVWEKKVEAYKKWGWSEDDFFIAFEKHPSCMIASQVKITKIMDFIVRKMGWEPSILAKRPGLISLSLEKRIVPRCLVYEVMLSKGLIKKYSLATYLEFPEKKFVDYIKSCEDEAPDLLKLYQEKLDLSK